MNRLKFVLIFFILGITSVWALESRSGQIKLVLEENKGTFAVYRIGQSSEPDVSLFVDEDTRTSSVSLLIDNRIYRMGQNSSFQQNAELTEQGARYLWENPSFEIILDFSFISSTGGSYSDGVKMILSVENKSEQRHNVGVKFLFDTYLGEEDSAHFLLPDNGDIKKEIEYSGSFPGWWRSGASSSDASLQVMMNSRGTTPPERVVFANWKRLNENSWFYESRANRNFNLLPYSINDSAVAHYYEIKSLESDKIRKVNIYMGLSGNIGFQEMTETQSASAAEPVVPVDTEDPYNLIQAIQVDITQVNKILGQIETALENTEDISDEELAAFISSVEELNERQSRYSVE